MEDRDPMDFVPLKQSAYRILLALGDETLHGYGIMQSLEAKTEGGDAILPGTLYAALARLAADGLVSESLTPEADESGGPKRRYYRRTDFGRAVVRAESERLRILLGIAAAQNLLPERA